MHHLIPCNWNIPFTRADVQFKQERASEQSVPLLAASPIALWYNVGPPSYKLALVKAINHIVILYSCKLYHVVYKYHKPAYSYWSYKSTWRSKLGPH